MSKKEPEFTDAQLVEIERCRLKAHPAQLARLIQADRIEIQWLSKKLDEAYQRAAEATEIMMEWGKCECGCCGLMPCVHMKTADWLKRHAAQVENIKQNNRLKLG